MRSIIICIAFLTLCSSLAVAQDEKYEKTLKEMFEVSGSEGAYKAAITQILQSFKQQYTQVDASVWDELEMEFLKTSLNDLTKMLAPVYYKYMTEDELVGIIKFYRSSVGKKFAESTPMIMQESMQVGQEWGAKIGRDFVKKMEERGY